ncbi:MCE family protein [Rhodococcus oxybenzonivorans]|jgi:phospholipid/cholesterol/gamma-HCH transport system substrate-binding protein|uniref:MCE family protein n=1 Tax=Rhodococcus TaxID=1827 RepID=UPI00202DDCC4|nr:MULTISPECIES: MCE family protein [Rhodococcus]MDV7353895.1 MCE family protein [Rhodococcus oxybenzonivorans]
MNACARLVGVLGAASILTGCGWTGINQLPLPGSVGTGDGSWSLALEMPDVSTLTENARVRVSDVTVGTVRSIEVEDDHALVTVSLGPDVELPDGTTAKIGATSLLGSAHVELLTPDSASATPLLNDGDRIPLDRADAYPTTEQTLSTVSYLLTGGGVGKLAEINREVGQALSGREDTVRSLLANLREVTDRLNRQRDEIVAALDGLDRFSAIVANDRDTLDHALQTLDPALATLNDQRENLLGAVDAIGRFSRSADELVTTSRQDLDADLRALEPALRGLADSGPALTSSLSLLATLPFPMNTYRNAVQGDFANLFLNLDLTTARLDRGWLTGTPAAGQLASLGGIIGQLPPLPPIDGNPLITPLDLGNTRPADQGGN